MVAAAHHDQASARRLIGEARRDYTAGRPGDQPIASGEALLAAIQQILSRQTQ
ncbi:MAG TPA: hypothetical protein VGS62_03355 [Streptosporangiaceae bacterium]|nr:hypothetical protein [Streptosporangiaceae bacterium]